MNATLKNNLAAYGSGVIFAGGLALSGMTQPDKVIGFLRITRDWNPSLAFVMGGAIAVHALLYHFWLKKKPKPFLATSFSIPSNKKIDGRLILGAALFGLGWGASGFCPGPAIVSTMSFDETPVLFVFFMIAGMTLHHFYEHLRQKRHASNHEMAHNKN